MTLYIQAHGIGLTVQFPYSLSLKMHIQKYAEICRNCLPMVPHARPILYHCCVHVSLVRVLKQYTVLQHIVAIVSGHVVFSWIVFGCMHEQSRSMNCIFLIKGTPSLMLCQVTQTYRSYSKSPNAIHVPPSYL